MFNCIKMLHSAQCVIVHYVLQCITHKCYRALCVILNNKYIYRANMSVGKDAFIHRHPV